MPKNSRVGRCYDKLKDRYGKGKAAAISLGVVIHNQSAGIRLVGSF